MMATSKYSGITQDPLDWFTNFGYEKEHRVILPEASPEPTAIAKKPTFVPIYKKCERGTSYAKTFLAEHMRNYQESMEEEKEYMKLHGGENRRFAMDDISSITDSTAGGDHLRNPTAAELTQVYMHYDFSKYSEKSCSLPVYNNKKEILQKIEEYPVVIVKGETGCGKSTQVPQFILDDGAQKFKHVNILVTQPRKIAATSLANRVCQERQWKNGCLVAYQIGLDNQCGPDTRLAYVTTEVFVQKIIAKKSLNEYTHIILDEVHERDEHTDFALLLVKKLLHTVSRHVKIILMSATIECEKFDKYFATPLEGLLIPAPTISITEKMTHKVHTYYLNSLRDAYPNGKMPSYDLDFPRISVEMIQMAVNLVHLFDDLERQEAKLHSHELASSRGAVLVFAPGLAEIEAIIELLRKDAHKKKWEMYPLHSSLTLTEQRAAFRPSDFQVRKIVVSTNIAESSVTLPDIKFVIDFCLTKVVTCDPLTNYTCLRLAWTSKSSCMQRAGRVGRVSSGRVYRLVEKEFYDDLEAHPTPEICRSPLSSVVLKTKQLNMGPPNAILALALDPPRLPDIYRTILNLKQIGCLGLKYDGSVSVVDGDLTPLGQVAAALPLDPKLSKLIMMGFLFGCLQETVIIAAGLSLKSFHSTPFQDELSAFTCKVSWAHRSFCDCLALLTAYKHWKKRTTLGEFASNRESERVWARKSYVQIENLKEVDKLVTELKKRLERLKVIRSGYDDLEENWNEETAFFVKMSIAAAFYPNYFKKNTPDDYERFIYRELSGKDPFTTLVVSGIPQEHNVLYGDQIKSLFKDCTKNLTLHFEGGKAFLEFPKRRHRLHKEIEGNDTEEMPGDCPTSMHLALKMKQVPRIRQMLRLKLISSLEARKYMDSLSTKSESDSASISGFSDDLTKRSNYLPPVFPHPSIQTIKVRVSHVENPSQFWVVLSGPATFEQEVWLENSIDMHVNKSSLSSPLSFFGLKTSCIAPYKEPHDKEYSYYRGRIEDFNKAKGKALVYFVDYGNSEIVDINMLLEIPNSLLTVPTLAIECTLSEIKPSSLISDPSGDKKWSNNCIQWFKNSTLDQESVGQIFSVVHNIIHLELFPLQMVNNAQIPAHDSFNRILVRRGAAVKAEELYLSKHNHDLRRVVQSKMSGSGAIKSLSSTLSSCTLSLDVDQQFPRTDLSATSVPVRGPWSPLEMKYVGLSRPGASKMVKLERNSVNSTHLDLEPQSAFDRLIVSAFVALTPNESGVILHHTTLMPILPGMLGLSLLMFCPYAELRVNKGGSEITGAIFGLGPEPGSDDPIYPDEDMEVAFDFALNHNDLVKINELRYLMSITLESFDEITLKELRNTQRCIRDTMKSILSENRGYCKPSLSDHSYEWNQVPSKDLRTPGVEGIVKKEKFVWQLISSVVLHVANHHDTMVEKTKKLRLLRTELKAEKKPGSLVIDEVCIMCQMPLRTYQDLDIHIDSKRHSIAEHKLYGLL